MAIQFDNLNGGTGGGGSFSAGVSTGGNTAGTTGVVGGRVVFFGGSNISLSQSINGQSATITINGESGAAGAATVFSNSNNVSFGLNGSTVTATATFPAQSAIKGFGVSNTGATAGNTGISTGIDWVLAGSNLLTLSQSTAVGGPNTVWFQHPAWLTTARGSTDAIGLATAGTNITWTANSAGLSINAGGYAGTGTAMTGGSVTLNSGGISINLPAYLTTARASTDAIGLNTAQSNVTWTVNSNGLSLDARGYAGTGFTGTNATGTAASNGFSLSIAAPIPIATAVNPVASANSTGTVTRYAPEDHRHAGIGGLGISTAGNSAGTSGSNVGTIWFQGGANITLSQITSNNGSHTIIVSAAAAAGLTNLRVSAGTTNNDLSAVSFADSNGISFGISASTITASANTVGTATTVYPVASANSVGTVTRWAAEDHRHAGIAISQFDPYQAQPVTNSTLGQSTIYMVPFDVQGYISASRINFFLSLTHTYSGAPANSTAWLAMGYGLYTRMTGTGSDRISLLTSYSLSYISASASSSTRLSVTNYVGLSNATSHTTSQYGVNNASVSNYLASSIAGFRVIALPMNLTLTPGRYWLGVSGQSASQGASLIFSHSFLQNQYSNNIAYRPFGAVSSASNASFYMASEGLGIYSAQSAAFPNSIPLTSDSIRGAPVMTLPYFNISGIGTNTNLL